MSKRRRAACVAAAAAVLIAGCAEKPQAFESTRALAEALGCTSTYERDEPESRPRGARETAFCESGEERYYYLAVFDDDDARDEYVAEAPEAPRLYVVGPGWSVRSDNPEDAEGVAEKLNGQQVEEQPPS